MAEPSVCILTGSGVVLNDDLLDFVGGPRHRDLPQNKGAFSAVGGLNLTYPAYRGYDALSYSTEGYFEYIPGWLQDRAPLSDTYNPGQAPLFAYGPPRLTRLEQEAIVNRQNNFNELDKGVVDGRQLEREIVRGLDGPTLTLPGGVRLPTVP